jgi:CheY-like chemotaxis protein
LGLATIYGVVKQNGGSIEVYSEEGSGTVFKIYLPRIHGEAKPLKTSDLKSLALGQETILLVEDEQVVRDLANRFLLKLGYHVLPHANANEALLAARNFPGEIHLLMTDVVMPGMNGPTLATELLKFRPNLKVLFASGYTEDAIVNHGMLAEGIQFIGKPYSIHVLAQKLRDVLASC